jgi:hypothetical protein
VGCDIAGPEIKAGCNSRRCNGKECCLMQYYWEVQDAMVIKTGIRLGTTDWTDKLTIDVDEDSIGDRYLVRLFGPFEDLDLPEDQRKDFRLFVVVRHLEGTVSLQLLVQDATDDAFLNSNAFGAEKYNIGPVNV